MLDRDLRIAVVTEDETASAEDIGLGLKIRPLAAQVAQLLTDLRLLESDFVELLLQLIRRGPGAGPLHGEKRRHSGDEYRDERNHDGGLGEALVALTGRGVGRILG